MSSIQIMIFWLVVIAVLTSIIAGYSAFSFTALRKSEQTLRDANARLVELSMRDGLTGIYNRRHFEDALDAEWRRARRSRQSLALLLIDIDHFKKLNDTCGHRAGDECLRQVALCLRENLHRPGDTLARYGGEEFVAILPDVDMGGALKVAETMRAAVEGLACRIHGIEKPPRVTVSIGVSSRLPGLEDVSGALVSAADAALYRAKAEGRNRVCDSEAKLVI
jgi:diguanylate cyclase (GGDEF)-like protein